MRCAVCLETSDLLNKIFSKLVQICALFLLILETQFIQAAWTWTDYRQEAAKLGCESCPFFNLKRPIPLTSSIVGQVTSVFVSFSFAHSVSKTIFRKGCTFCQRCVDCGLWETKFQGVEVKCPFAVLKSEICLPFKRLRSGALSTKQKRGICAVLTNCTFRLAIPCTDMAAISKITNAWCFRLSQTEANNWNKQIKVNVSSSKLCLK